MEFFSSLPLLPWLAQLGIFKLINQSVINLDQLYKSWMFVIMFFFDEIYIVKSAI